MTEIYGATAVVTHHVVDGKQVQYEDWMAKIGAICRTSEGNIDWQLIRPIEGVTSTYTFIIRFDSIGNLRRWMESETRKELISKVDTLLVHGDVVSIKSGLDFLFQPDALKSPKRWKQYLVTWSAIYPLSMLVPFLVLPLLRSLGLPQQRLIDALVVSGTIVFVMIYLLMPRYTKLIRKWLSK